MELLFIRKKNKFSEFYEKCFESLGIKSFIISFDEYKAEILKKFKELHFLILEFEENQREIKIIEEIRNKFKHVKVILLIEKFDQPIHSLIKEYSINLYLTPPFLPSKIFKSIFILLDSCPDTSKIFY